MAEKISNARIKPSVFGIERSKEPMKAVIYYEEKGEIKILAEKVAEKDELDLDLGMATEDLPETVKLAVIPKEIKSKILIRRLVESELAPTATIKRDVFHARGGIVTAEDLVLKGIDDLIPIWKLKHKVCGKVIKKHPITGEDCPVPGATVHILDVDLHFFWWYPYPGLPWCWLFPFWFRREEIATTTTDECGRFCVDIPFFDIDAILRWRLRFRCLWDLLKPPRVIDAIDLGVKPDLRFYSKLEHLPEMKYKTKSDSEIQTPVIPLPPPEPYSLQSNILRETPSQFWTDPKFELARRSLSSELFEPLGKERRSVMEKPAFPMPIAPPALPDDEKLLKLLPERSMLSKVRNASPILRLLPCWVEVIPEIKLFLDVPDIVFKVEQDINGDGKLETIYDQGFFDVNWDLNKPTTNVVIQAWGNAICVPCGGTGYQPCTSSGIVGINDMPVDTAYLKNGYAVRVNRPKPNGIRPEAETPFCSVLRLVGCPGYKQAAFYRVLYSYKGAEKPFNESWYLYKISSKTPHLVVPDSQGFYPVLTPASDYYPYHTLINWPSYSYPDGKYKVRLELYDAAHNPILPKLPEVEAILDNSQPSIVDFLSLRWREAGTGTWNPLSLDCPIIYRNPKKDIEIEVKYNVAAAHLRDLGISLVGCKGGSTYIGGSNYWHKAVGDNNVVETWTVNVLSTMSQGAYYFYLEGRSRAFNATGGLAVNWEFDPLHIYRGRTLNLAIIDS